MAATDELIAAEWQAAGWRVQRQPLDLTNEPGNLDYKEHGTRLQHLVYPALSGVNLIAELPGQSKEAIVFVGHHDTVRGSPGADDNGAAVVALLVLARLLAGRRFRRTVILATPDFEEIGLIGSRHLVPWLRERYRVTGAIVLDAIGYFDPTPGAQHLPGGIGALYPGQIRRLRARGFAGDTLFNLYQARGAELARTWARCLATTIGRDRVLLVRDPHDLPVLGPVARAIPATRNFSRSDHVDFWRARLPAVMVSTTGEFRNPNYHEPTDLPATLDYETLADIVAAAALAVEQLAG